MDIETLGSGLKYDYVVWQLKKGNDIVLSIDIDLQLKINEANGVVGVFSFIAICIGLFAFARQAPKFIKQVLGMKDDGGKGVFSGFGEISNALGIGAAAVGSIGAFNAARAASRTADLVNHGEDYANNIFNRGKHLVAGIAGGVGGLATGMSTAMTAKDHANRAVMDALQKRNATAIARGGSGSTALGRLGSSFTRLGLGDTPFDSATRDISSLKAVETSGKDLFSYLEGKGKVDGASMGLDFTLDGTHYTGTLDEFSRKRAEAEANFRRTGNDNDAKFTYSGRTFDYRDAYTNKVQDELTLAAGAKWAESKWDNSANEGRGGYTDAGLNQKWQTFEEAGKWVRNNADTGPVSYERGDPRAVKKLKDEMKGAGGRALRKESDPRYKRKKANYGATDKK